MVKSRFKLILEPVPEFVLSVYCSLTIILTCGVGGGRDAVLIQVVSYLIIIKSFYFGLGPPVPAGQVAASCFHCRSRQSPFAFSLTKFSFLSVCASSTIVLYFWAHCPKDKIYFPWWPRSQGSHRKPGGFIAQLYLCPFRKCQGSTDVQKALTSNHHAVGHCLNKSAELSQCWNRLHLSVIGALVCL